MKANLKSVGGFLLVASVFSFTGAVNAAEPDFGYCTIPPCQETAKENIFMSLLGLGKAELNWWECRVQNDCSNISKSIGSLQITQDDCSTSKLEFYRKDINAFDYKLLDVLRKIDPQMATADDTPPSKGLETDLVQHFLKCEKAGYFKPDTSTCTTPACERMMTRVDNLQVNEEGCVKGLNALNQSIPTHYDFPFEEALIKAQLDAFREKCVAASLLPATTVLGRPVFKKDEDFAKQCEQMVNGIEQKTAESNVTKEGCTLDLYNELNKQVATLKTNLEKLDSMAIPVVGQSNKYVDVTGELSDKIDKHFMQCADKGLFPPDTTICFSEECKETQAKIEAFPVDKEQCAEAPKTLEIHTKYHYERQVIENTLTAYKQKCIDANILPAAVIFDRIVYKKDMPLAEQCQSMESNLEKQLTSLPVDEANCKDDVYSKLEEELGAFKDEMTKLQAATEQKPAYYASWLEHFTSGYAQKIDRHFIECESQNLFPQNASICRSEECKQQVAKIAAFKFDKESCVEAPRQINFDTTFKYERTILKDALASYKQKCINDNIIPEAEIYDRIVYHKDMPIAVQCKSMGDALENQLKGMEINKADCLDSVFDKMKSEYTSFQEGLAKLAEVTEPKFKDNSGMNYFLNNLQKRLVDHFYLCEGEKLFPQDPNVCRSAQCQQTVAEIEAFKVDQEDCTEAPKKLQSNWWFRYESDVIKDKLAAYKQKCIDANILPEAEIYERVIFHKDMPLAEECQSMGNSLQSRIKALDENSADCQDSLFDELTGELSDFRGKLAKLEAVTKSKFTYESWVGHVTNGMERDIVSHFYLCEDRKLFPEDKTICRSALCREWEAKINALKVDEADCIEGVKKLSTNQYYRYERDVLKATLENYKRKCVEANIIPATEILDRIVYYKDLPLAEKCKSMGEELEAKIKAMKVNAENCKDALFFHLKDEVKAYKDELEKLAATTKQRYPNESWLNRLIRDPDRHIEEHFRECQDKKLFPQSGSMCYSNLCKETQAKIEAFEVNQTACKQEPRKLNLQYRYSSEGKFLHKLLQEYEEKCKKEA